MSDFDREHEHDYNQVLTVENEDPRIQLVLIAWDNLWATDSYDDFAPPSSEREAATAIEVCDQYHSEHPKESPDRIRQLESKLSEVRQALATAILAFDPNGPIVAVPGNTLDRWRELVKS